MLLEQMSWMDVEKYLKNNDRLVMVTGSTENHAYLSLGTDTQCPWEIAKAACEKENVVLAPALHYGMCRHWMAYPGTVSLNPKTYLDLISDLLSSFMHHGFNRILILNGHGGNDFVKSYLGGYREDNPEVMIKYRNWFQLPEVSKFMEKLGGIEDHHASWVEGFPWINQVGPLPAKEKPDVDWKDYGSLTPEELRERMGDGSGGGAYSMDEKTMRKYFQVAVEDVLNILQGDWMP